MFTGLVPSLGSINATLCKDNEHLWRHVNESLTDFKMPTYDCETGVPCNQKRMGMHPHMMLYAMDEMFHIFQGMGANDLDGQHIIAYKILALASLCCTEWCSCTKKGFNSLGNAYSLVDLTDVHDLEHLAWAVYDSVFIPGNPPMLTGHHDWSCIITGMPSTSFSMAKLWRSIALHVQWRPSMPSGSQGLQSSRSCSGQIRGGSPELY